MFDSIPYQAFYSMGAGLCIPIVSTKELPEWEAPVSFPHLFHVNQKNNWILHNPIFWEHMSVKLAITNPTKTCNTESNDPLISIVCILVLSSTSAL